MSGTTDTAADLSDLNRRSREFAGEVLFMLSEVLPCEVKYFLPQVATDVDKATVTVDFIRIPMYVKQQEILNLSISYHLTARAPADGSLTVEKSAFKFWVHGVKMPLFTLDYLRNASGDIPVAHYNVYAKRDDMTWAMANAGRAFRGKRRRKQIDKGERSPQFSDLHFPTGGSRFRPSLEDVLQFAILEFGIDTRPDAIATLAEGRRNWRQLQLRAAIGDNLLTAADELRAHGFEVVAPKKQFAARAERLEQY